MGEAEPFYQIGSGKTPVVLSGLLAAVFGGLAVWLRATRSDAFPLLALFACFALLVFLLTLYRFFAFRVRIDADGVYCRTRPGNGRRYRYAEIRRAWQSGGLEHADTPESYCHLSLADGRLLRFPFYPNDEEAIEYLLAQVAVAQHDAETPEEYRIDGKYFGRSRLAVGVILLALLLGGLFAARSLEIRLFLLPGVALALALCIFLAVRYFCFSVRIGDDGFFCRTTPRNGRFYPYREVVACRVIRRVVRRRGSRRLYSVGQGVEKGYFLFEFTCADGARRRFVFENAVSGHEIDVLQSRIQQGKSAPLAR